jgi:hypothetical protein
MPEIPYMKPVFRCAFAICMVVLCTQMLGCIHSVQGTSLVFENRSKIPDREIKVFRHYSISKWTSIPFYGRTTKRIASFTQKSSPSKDNPKINFRHRHLLYFPSSGSEQWDNDEFFIAVNVTSKMSDYHSNFLDSSTLKEGTLSWPVYYPRSSYILKEIPIQIRIDKSFKRLGEMLALTDGTIANMTLWYNLDDSASRSRLGTNMCYLYITNPSKDSAVNGDSVFMGTKMMLALIPKDASTLSEKMELTIYLEKPINDRYRYSFPIQPVKNQDTVLCDLNDAVKKTIEMELTIQNKEPWQ